jgi:hypothetical protein
MDVGKGLDHKAGELPRKKTERGFEYRCHLLPHDIEAREISTSRSRRQTLEGLIPRDEPIITVPRISSVEDGINAARALMGSAYFDERRCKQALPCCAATTARRWASRSTALGRTAMSPTPSGRPPSASTSSTG